LAAASFVCFLLPLSLAIAGAVCLGASPHAEAAGAVFGMVAGILVSRSILRLLDGAKEAV
jgi:hypothetical protein